MKLKSLIRWFNLFDRKKLNLKTLNERTDHFEALLKKYGEKEPEVQDLYNSLKPLFQQIRNGEITKPKDDKFLAGTRRWMQETPPVAQYSDLLFTYGEFLTDLTGDRENPLYGDNGPIAYLNKMNDHEISVKQVVKKMKEDLAEVDRKEREARKKKKENQSNS